MSVQMAARLNPVAAKVIAAMYPPVYLREMAHMSGPEPVLSTEQPWWKP
jgi:hypothetical protein